ncbi:unnamed protein product [Adineta ricciae]|uniref:SAM dependent carboxyl methyltransferase n=1 Tax=Adineta ricciae TaxID=249248 RepID=A0A816BQT9_ADIRI|nr:unnamed protein product [Adineta ricciae]CAF1612261.1 unnamed protein product [Adineta ricciae]
MTTNTGATSGMVGSYNNNSSPQLALIESAIPLIKKAIEKLKIDFSLSYLVLADFGCSHGANSIYIMKIIANFIKDIQNWKKSFLFIHNDLPTNDWKELFDLINQQDQSYHGLANGCSFYEACLQPNSLTIAFSSASIHWLSRKPCNISNHCISIYAQGEELQLFRNQSKIDYENFLKNRSIELIENGILILVINCLNENNLTMTESVYELLYECSRYCLLTKEELDEYTIPVYIRSYDECIDINLFKKYSFELIDSTTSCVDFQFYDQLMKKELTLDTFAKVQMGVMKSATQSILQQTLQFSKKRSNHEIIQLTDRFWNYYHDQVKLNPERFQLKCCQTYLILKKISNKL